MNPWHPYWKGLENIFESLRGNVGPAPVSGALDTARVVKGLTYMDLMWSDHQCALLWEELLAASQIAVGPEFPVNVQWQSMLRCECGIDFCRGRWGARKTFDWTQRPEIIYRALLIDFWRSDALLWASRLDPSRVAICRESAKQTDLPSALHFAL